MLIIISHTSVQHETKFFVPETVPTLHMMMNDLQSRESSTTSRFIDSKMNGVEWDVDTLVRDLTSHSSQQLVTDEESCFSIRDCALLTRGCERSESGALGETAIGPDSYV